MLKRKTYAWTEEDEAKLAQMAEQGIPVRNVALRLKRSESSIKKRAQELQVKFTAPRRKRFRFDRQF